MTVFLLRVRGQGKNQAFNHMLRCIALTQEWFKANYRDCVEGLLSMVLYLSLVMEERRAALPECSRMSFAHWRLQSQGESLVA